MATCPAAELVVDAASFMAFGADCYKLEGGFGFAPMLWISVHAFSTIGFGNLAPLQTCAGPQFALLVESFVSLVVVSSIGGYGPRTRRPNPGGRRHSPLAAPAAKSSSRRVARAPSLGGVRPRGVAACASRVLRLADAAAALL